MGLQIPIYISAIISVRWQIWLLVCNNRECSGKWLDQWPAWDRVLKSCSKIRNTVLFSTNVREQWSASSDNGVPTVVVLTVAGATSKQALPANFHTPGQTCLTSAFWRRPIVGHNNCYWLSLTCDVVSRVVCEAVIVHLTMFTVSGACTHAFHLICR